MHEVQVSAKRSMLLEGLPPEELQRVESRVTVQTYPSGSVLLGQGSWKGILYLVRTGVLTVDVETAGGRTRQVAKLIPGECAGEMSLLTGMPASATVSVLADATVGELRHIDFMELLGSCPTLARNVSIILSQRLSVTLREEKPGFTRLMRLRVHPDVPPALPGAIARSVAEHLATPLLVVDHRPGAEWPEHERVPALESLLESPEALGELQPNRAPAIFVAAAEGARPESWVRFEAFLPEHITHGLQVTGIDRAGGLPPPDLAEVDMDVTLWPEEVGTPPDGTADVTLLSSGEARNSRAALERESRRLGARAVRIVGADGATGADIGWIARHLARLKVGVALGGGGARGGAHLGVLDGLLRSGVPVDYVTGCSVGAGLAAGFAHGLGIDDLLGVMQTFSSRAIKYTIPRYSLLSSNGIKNVYQDILGDTPMEELPLPLAVVAADVIRGREVVLDRGLAWKAVLASTSLPGIYPPVWIGEYCLVDGGVLDPVPALAARGIGADVVLAVRLDASGERRPVWGAAAETPPGHSPMVIHTIQRAFEVMATEITAHMVDGADVVIRAETEAMGLREFKEGAKLLPGGRAALAREWRQVGAVLPWLRNTTPAVVP